jgi:AraC-like DNA-binding protein
VLLVYTKKSNSNAFYLALFFILSSTFGLAHHFVFQTADVFWIAVFFNHFVPFMFLIGPFLYFYVRATLNETKKLSGKDILHFVPALISLLGTIPYYCTPFATKISIAQQLIDHINSIRSINVNLFYDAGESFILRTILCLVYVLFSGYRVIVYYKKNTERTRQQKVVLRWLTILIGATLIIVSLFLMMAFEAAFVKINETISNTYPFYLTTGILYFLLTLAILQFPTILYSIPKKEGKKRKKDVRKASKNTVKESQNKMPAKTLDSDVVAVLCSNIEKYFTDEKPYLDPQFSVFTIAVALGVSETQVNHAIKIGMKTSFAKLRSDLRVSHAIQLLQNTPKEQWTIEAIGEKSGFKTRSNFYSAFKEATGVTPNEYSKKIK